jgi:hypothetical protein
MESGVRLGHDLHRTRGFKRLRVKTLLLTGDADRTAPGSNRAPPDVAARLGNDPELARRAVRMIPDAKLIEFP